MGAHAKALVVTTLIMEVTTLVALTAVWALLSELHFGRQVIIGGLIATGIAAADHRPIGAPQPLQPPNLIGTPATKHPPAHRPGRPATRVDRPC